jgi:hypothetical protein
LRGWRLTAWAMVRPLNLQVDRQSDIKRVKSPKLLQRLTATRGHECSVSSIFSQSSH